MARRQKAEGHIIAAVFFKTYLYESERDGTCCDAYHPNTWQVVARGSVQGHPQLCGEFKVTLGYVSPFIS